MLGNIKDDGQQYYLTQAMLLVISFVILLFSSSKSPFSYADQTKVQSDLIYLQLHFHHKKK